METADTARDLIIDCLHKMKEKVEKALKFYTDVFDKVDEEDQWNLFRQPPPTTYFVTPSSANPVEYLSEMLELMAFLRQAIESFSIDQLAAFYLGLGFPGLDLPFLGFPQAQRNIERVRRTKKYYDELLEKKLPEGEHWKVKKSIPVGLEFIPPDETDPRDYLAHRLRLFEAQIFILAELPIVTIDSAAYADS